MGHRVGVRAGGRARVRVGARVTVGVGVGARGVDARCAGVQVIDLFDHNRRRRFRLDHVAEEHFGLIPRGQEGGRALPRGKVSWLQSKFVLVVAVTMRSRSLPM